MPSKSEAQARLMAAAAHTPGGYDGVPQKVGKDFNQADKGGKLLSRAAKDRPEAEKGKTKMGRLTPKERGKLPAKDFAGPGRSYPVEDKAHARAAKGFAAMHHAPDKAAIDRKADKVLVKSGGSRFDRMSRESSKMATGKRK
jgi:hypothetical protein